ncbi:hypothetical protein W97_02374 [Coniosporium apollinis CBS 100218]|uniref:Major facilitator superfamily (MFS) profile domain-containing protein n=1 Tax=Coniosporium apollinis (strain CBS 100218) TaxID=1168221 RepID=R7YMM6_CONA1|nr:uncharacterized protein W97_02374 [Coniosporium apollinis CBS 100218]EON63147.1 hypothetical protein W97_02374 [Coniosporium apollinis CBS 100218]
MFVALGGFTYGFGFSAFVTCQGQPGFYSDFNLDPASTHTAHVLDAVNALFTAGAAIGSIAQSFIADKYGRRIGLGIAAICALVGAALTAGSVTIPMMIVVRLLMGFGLGMVICLVPLYLSEVAPPRRRGLLAGMTVLSFGTGYLVVAWIAVGTYFASSQTVAWRVPLALACVGPMALLCALPAIPETPRYLIWAGKKEQAWKVLHRLHRNPRDAEDRVAHAEYTQIVLQVEHDKDLGAGFIQMFRLPTWRRRAFSAIFLLFASQSTGITGISNFLPVIFSGLGLTGVMPLVMYGVWTTIGTLAVAVSIVIVDRVGRRTLLLIGYPLLAILLLSQALLQNAYINPTDTNPNKGGLAACLLFLILYIICYQCVDAPSFIWASEIWPTPIRGKGVSLSFFAYFVGGLTYTTPSALAFKNIGWHMYLLYMGLSIISGILVYFIIPETKGLPMEELAALFGDEVMVHLTADDTGFVESGPKIQAIGAQVIEFEEKIAYEDEEGRGSLEDSGKISGTQYHVETVN